MTDVVKLLGLKDEFAHIPFKFETDVNAPAMAEYTRIQSPGITSSAYITVGTGLGVGVVVNNNAVHGLLHPEAGHMLPQRKEGDTFPGVCPFHGACFEGMICSKALAARANCGIEDLPSLPDDHEVWDVFAFYLAQLCANLVYMVSIQRIAIGGGVLNRLSVLPKVRSHMKALMNGYIQVDKVTDLMQLENFVVSPHWGSKTGLIGASYLAYLAIQEQK
jgi:fructokinase